MRERTSPDTVDGEEEDSLCPQLPTLSPLQVPMSASVTKTMPRILTKVTYQAIRMEANIYITKVAHRAIRMEEKKTQRGKAETDPTTSNLQFSSTLKKVVGHRLSDALKEPGRNKDPE